MTSTTSINTSTANPSPTTTEIESSQANPKSEPINSRNIHLANPEPTNTKANDNKSKGNIFARFWNWIKSLFGGGSTAKKAETQATSTTSPTTDTGLPQVTIHPYIVKIDHIPELSQEYVILLSDTVQGNALVGQATVTQNARKLYPGTVIGIPVGMDPSSSLDPQEVRATSLSDDNLTENITRMETAIDEAIHKSRMTNKPILVPKGGYGTGTAKLWDAAPETFKGLTQLLESKLGLTWEKEGDMVSLQHINKIKQGSKADDLVAGKKIKTDLWTNPEMLIDHGKSYGNNSKATTA